MQLYFSLVSMVIAIGFDASTLSSPITGHPSSPSATSSLEISSTALFHSGFPSTSPSSSSSEVSLPSSPVHLTATPLRSLSYFSQTPTPPPSLSAFFPDLATTGTTSSVAIVLFSIPVLLFAPFTSVYESGGMADPVWQPPSGHGMDGLASLPPLLQSIQTVNVTTYVTTTLASIDVFLLWRTQFTGFVIMHHLYGMLDSPIPSLLCISLRLMVRRNPIRPIAICFRSISYFVLSSLLLSPVTPSLRYMTYHICFLFFVNILNLDLVWLAWPVPSTSSVC